jgi:hypothetical protein
LAGLVSRNQGGEGVEYVVKGMNCDIMSSCDYRHSSVKRALQSSASAPNTIVTPLQGALRMFDEFLSTMFPHDGTLRRASKMSEPDAGLEPATVVSIWRSLKFLDERNLLLM